MHLCFLVPFFEQNLMLKISMFFQDHNTNVMYAKEKYPDSIKSFTSKHYCQNCHKYSPPSKEYLPITAGIEQPPPKTPSLTSHVTKHHHTAHISPALPPSLLHSIPSYSSSFPIPPPRQKAPIPSTPRQTLTSQPQPQNEEISPPARGIKRQEGKR